MTSPKNTTVGRAQGCTTSVWRRVEHGDVGTPLAGAEHRDLHWVGAHCVTTGLNAMARSQYAVVGQSAWYIGEQNNNSDQFPRKAASRHGRRRAWCSEAARGRRNQRLNLTKEESEGSRTPSNQRVDAQRKSNLEANPERSLF